ncbi:HAD-IIA family hydrolase [Arthrobacter zhaoguopingii]|uniref:HAD-IIA family hydrolase n=1 Tax=Arthrobacter zhaoguopingii TaxID=2681491 RepID=UPI001FEF07FF|nr:HAD-IIA family hydrolase [Arthrobacter zhaoguopingii]
MEAEGALIGAYDAVLSDLDGVVYAGPHAIAGAIEALTKLLEVGVKLAYITNNASRSADEVAAHLRSLGAPARGDQVFGSALAGAELLAGLVPAGSKVLVTGSRTLADAVRSHRLIPVDSAEDGPDAVIQGFSPELGWRDLAEASYAIAAGAVWVATNTDMSIPQARGIAPGNGSLVAAVAAATGTRPVVAGKPEAPLFTTAARHLGSERPLVVGDRLDTDILGGNRAGMDTALILTGVDTVRTALAAVAAERPTYLLPDLGGLYEPYPPVTADDGAYRCGTDSARVEAGAVRVEGSESSLNAWRAACAAWWAAAPALETARMPDLRFTGAAA